MERWNELAAGYVLGNLTLEEQEELSVILRENPQLQVEIARLRKTATINRTQLSEKAVEHFSIERLTAGSEGWSDTIAPLSDPLPESSILEPPLSVSEQGHPSFVSAECVSTDRSVDESGWLNRVWVKLGAFWQQTSLWGWLMTLMLVGVALDNWRVRRLLAIAQEQILLLELSVDYKSK